MCSSDLSPRDWQGLVSSLDSKPGDTQGAPEEASKVVRCLLGMCLSSVQSQPISLELSSEAEQPVLGLSGFSLLGQIAASATPLGSD